MPRQRRPVDRSRPMRQTRAVTRILRGVIPLMEGLDQRGRPVDSPPSDPPNVSWSTLVETYGHLETRRAVSSRLRARQTRPVITQELVPANRGLQPNAAPDTPLHVNGSHRSGAGREQGRRSRSPRSPARNTGSVVASNMEEVQARAYDLANYHHIDAWQTVREISREPNPQILSPPPVLSPYEAPSSNSTPTPPETPSPGPEDGMESGENIEFEYRSSEDSDYFPNPESDGAREDAMVAPTAETRHRTWPITRRSRQSGRRLGFESDESLPDDSDASEVARWQHENSRIYNSAVQRENLELIASEASRTMMQALENPPSPTSAWNLRLQHELQQATPSDNREGYTSTTSGMSEEG